MAHEFFGSVEFWEPNESEARRDAALRKAENIAFDHAREYIRNKEFSGFKIESRICSIGKDRSEAKCNLIFYQAI